MHYCHLLATVIYIEYGTLGTRRLMVRTTRFMTVPWYKVQLSATM